MTGIRFDHDDATLIPLPADAVADPGAWSRDAVEPLADAHGLTEETRARISAALESELGRVASEGGVSAFVFEPTTAAWSVLRIGVTDGEMPSEEISRFLWPEAVMPPQVWRTPPTPVGDGCSSVVLTSLEPALAEIRWLFVPRGRTIVAVLSPVPAHAVMLSGVIVEQVLATLRIEGVDPLRSEAFDPEQLIQRSDPDERTWAR